MEELVNQIAQRTGIPADKARAAVDTVVGYLKERLPGPIASQLDNAVSGKPGGNEGEGVGGAATELGRLFGKK